MALIAIPTTTVTCTDGTTDSYVGLNPNTDSDYKVQAFVDCFKDVAINASSICYNLPIKLVLAQWVGECGWATGSSQKANQNFSNMVYSSPTNPVGNIGKGMGGIESLSWAKFEGKSKHATGYGHFFINNSRYASLISYLQYCQLQHSIPDASVCANTIANAGFGGSDHKAYYENLIAWMKTIDNHATI